MTATKTPGGVAGASPDPFRRTKTSDIGFAWVIVEFAPDGILVSDDDGQIMMANRQIEELFGYDRDALVGKQVEYLLAPRSRDGTGTDIDGELVGRHADGTEFPIEISASQAFSTDQGVATVVAIRDVTEQHARQQAAHAASTLAHDEQIAADLHDRVIGHLFGCGLTLASVLGHDRINGRVEEQLRDVIDRLDHAISEIRSTVFACNERNRGLNVSR